MRVDTSLVGILDLYDYLDNQNVPPSKTLVVSHLSVEALYCNTPLSVSAAFTSESS